MFKTLFAATVVAAFALPAHAVTLAKWDFETTTPPTGSSNSYTGAMASTGTGTAGGFHSIAATFTTATLGNGSAKSLASTGWSIGDYWQFDVSTTGYSGVSISFDQAGTATGPGNFKLAFSTDGVTFTDFAAYNILRTTWSATVPSATSTYTFDLSSVTALNNSASVSVRLINTSSVSLIGEPIILSNGRNYIDNVTILATPVPEPGTYALMLAGLGAMCVIARRRT